MQKFNYRPLNFGNFIGKNELKKNLLVFINSSIKQNKALDHILFYGLPGVGKTTLATLIANELNVKIHYIQGSSIKQISDVLDMSVSIKERDIVFIDEVHNVDSKCLEFLYSMMEDFVIDVKLGKSLNSHYSRLKIPNFTLIASTNFIYKLPEPFIERFGIKFYIDSYQTSEIKEILSNLNRDLDFKLLDSEIELISLSSKGIPRIAINLFKRFIDYKLVSNIKDANLILKTIGVYTNGLEKQDIQYLNILSSFDKAMGLRSISQVMGLDIRSIELKIEPYLLKNGYILKTNSGRKITTKGKEILNKV